VQHHVDRRGAGLVLAVVAAVTLVAVAARGDHAGRGSSALSFPETVTATTQAVVLIVLGLLALGMCALFLWSIPASGSARPRRSTSRMLAGAALFVACALLFSWVRPHDGSPGRSPRAGSSGGVVGGGDTTSTAGGRSTTPAWGLGGAGVLVLVALGGAILWARRDRSTPISRPADVIATLQERDDAVAIAMACADPRRAVLLAFAAAEAVLSVDATTRRPPSTSAREWSAVVGLAPLAALVSRYEIARFSQHDVTAADRAAALDALAAMT
jgi:hypothetical protein